MTFPREKLVPSGCVIELEIARALIGVAVTAGEMPRLAGMMMNHWESGGFLGAVLVPVRETV